MLQIDRINPALILTRALPSEEQELDRPPDTSGLLEHFIEHMPEVLTRQGNTDNANAIHAALTFFDTCLNSVFGSPFARTEHFQWRQETIDAVLRIYEEGILFQEEVQRSAPPPDDENMKIWIAADRGALEVIKIILDPALNHREKVGTIARLGGRRGLSTSRIQRKDEGKAEPRVLEF